MADPSLSYHCHMILFFVLQVYIILWITITPDYTTITLQLYYYWFLAAAPCSLTRWRWRERYQKKHDFWGSKAGNIPRKCGQSYPICSMYLEHYHPVSFFPWFSHIAMDHLRPASLATILPVAEDVPGPCFPPWPRSAWLHRPRSTSWGSSPCRRSQARRMAPMGIRCRI